MKRSRIWIGDWLRAWAHREAGAENDGAALAHALGLSLEDPSLPATLSNTSEVPLAIVSNEESISVTANEPRTAQSPVDAEMSRANTAATHTFEVTIEHLSPREEPDLQILVQPTLPSPANRLPVREVEPLFSRASERALLGAAVATWRHWGPVAIQGIVEELARGRLLKQLPRQIAPAVQAGAVLLIERAIAEPFAADVVALHKQLRRVVGQSVLIEWWLGEHAALQPRSAHAPAWPPPPTMPVLAVVRSPKVLAPRIAELRERRCPLIAIAPGRGARSAEYNLTVIGWDHRTTVAAVSRARRKAMRR